MVYVYDYIKSNNEKAKHHLRRKMRWIC